MALSKIELKLGKKVITLTPKQFEELKQDMRDLDKDHHYYWHNYSWPKWYYNQPQRFPYDQILCSSTAGSAYTSNTSTSGEFPNNAAVRGSDLITSQLNQLDVADQTDPPAFNGTLLSVA